MNINIEKELLLNGLNTVGRAISSKSIESLSGVYIETNDNNKLILRGTDTDISIETMIDVEISSPGKMLVDYKIFSEVIKKLPNDLISINNEQKETQVEISCQKSLFTIMTLNSAEYPSFPSIDKKIISFSLNAATLKNLISSTIFAVAIDDTRPILKGILVEAKSNVLTLVGLDGYRIAIKSANIDIDKDFEVVIDGKHLAEIAKMCSTGDITIDITNNHILFDINGTIIICRLLEGKYVNYRSLVPAEFNFSIELIGEDFYQALERATLITKENSKLINLTIDYSKEIVIISSKSTMGTSIEEIPISINGLSENFEIAFNSKYLVDIFKNSTVEEFVLSFNGPINPCIIQGKDIKDETFLVLPIRRM